MLGTGREAGSPNVTSVVHIHHIHFLESSELLCHIHHIHRECFSELFVHIHHIHFRGFWVTLLHIHHIHLSFISTISTACAREVQRHRVSNPEKRLLFQPGTLLRLVGNVLYSKIFSGKRVISRFPPYPPYPPLLNF